MRLLLTFLVVAAVGGQLTRSFDWRGYLLLAAGAVTVAASYYFSLGLL